MKILLDTHIFLWFISGDIKLSTDVRDAIRDPDELAPDKQLIELSL